LRHAEEAEDVAAGVEELAVGLSLAESLSLH